MAERKMEQVILGAGDYYVDEYAGGEIDFETLIVPGNAMGETKGGATLTYTPVVKKIESDSGRLKKTFMSKATAQMKTGLLSFTLRSLAALQSVGQCTLASDGKSRTLKLGGGKAELRQFAVGYEYKGENGYKLRVGMVASNTSPLTLAMATENETVPDITFDAESNGVDDTIVVIEEIFGYKLSADTSAQSGKTYYTKSGDTFAEVESPTGSPKDNGWYEEIIETA